ncbi:MAG TPA: penicillin-binding transpeptidase domain-containing protein, partial [Saprospiraceae bacterium]|nr:penicillin-binding transpeptidase domain-containing protein [Saprospiraceae bacterium]
GMEGAVSGGTATLAYIWDLPVCGKTGTAQNNHGEDHSVFFGFAPKDNPKIAISVYVENAGWGGSYAAPIASLIIEKYINGFINENRKYLEQRMIEVDLINQP